MSIYREMDKLTTEQQRALWGTQEFYRAYSAVSGGRQMERDLFEAVH